MGSSSAPPGGSGKHYTWPELTLACMLCRNDIDRVGVRAGCNLTMWAGDDYTGQVRSWAQPHRWLVLQDSLDYASMHENINSLHCSCHTNYRAEGHTYTE